MYVAQSSYFPLGANFAKKQEEMCPADMVCRHPHCCPSVPGVIGSWLAVVQPPMRIALVVSRVIALPPVFPNSPMQLLPPLQFVLAEPKNVE